jgi:iron complex outermembrane receptor protein
MNDQFNFEAAARYTADHKYGFEQLRVIEFNDPLITPTLTANELGAFTPGIDITSGAIGNTVLTTRYPGTGLPVLDPATGYYVRSLNANWGAWTGDATLNWTPDSETLAYAKYSRGYKTGGFSAGQDAANPETQPEYVDAFEIGLKKTLGSAFTLNGAAFYYNYQNDQQPINVTIGNTSTTTSQIFNIPSVHTYGVELEGVWKPIDPLTLTAEYSYLSSKVASTGGHCFENTADPLALLPGAVTTGCVEPTTFGAPIVQNIKGYTLPESPPNKIAVNALYTFTFDPGKLIISASYIWKDKTYGELFNNPQTAAPAYSTVNLRAEWDDAKDRFTASVFVNNVFNTIGYDNVTETQIAPLTSFGVPYDIVSGKGLTYPLTFGGEIQVRFR